MPAACTLALVDDLAHELFELDKDVLHPELDPEDLTATHELVREVVLPARKQHVVDVVQDLDHAFGREPTWVKVSQQSVDQPPGSGSPDFVRHECSVLDVDLEAVDGVMTDLVHHQ